MLKLNIQKYKSPPDGLFQKILNTMQGRPGYAEVYVYPRRVLEVQGEGGTAYQISPKQVNVYDSNDNFYYTTEPYKAESVYDYELKENPNLKKLWNKKTKGVYGGHSKIVFEANGGDLQKYQRGRWIAKPDNSGFEFVTDEADKGYSVDFDNPYNVYYNGTLQSNTPISFSSVSLDTVEPVSKEEIKPRLNESGKLKAGFYYIPLEYNPIFDTSNFNSQELGKAINWYTDKEGNYYRKTRSGKYKPIKSKKVDRKRKELDTILDLRTRK